MIVIRGVDVEESYVRLAYFLFKRFFRDRRFIEASKRLFP